MPNQHGRRAGAGGRFQQQASSRGTTMTLRITLKSAFAAAMMLAAAGLTTQASADAVDDITKAGAINRGTLEDTSLTQAAPASADIRRFDNYNSVIQAFISGQTQLMVVGNDVGAQVLAKQDALKPEQKFQLLTSPSHIGLNKNEDRLKKAVNDAVAKMLADGKLDESSKA